MKVGDKVVCIRSEGTRSLIKNKEYVISRIGTDAFGYKCVCLVGKGQDLTEDGCLISRFRKIEPKSAVNTAELAQEYFSTQPER